MSQHKTIFSITDTFDNNTIHFQIAIYVDNSSHHASDFSPQPIEADHTSVVNFYTKAKTQTFNNVYSATKPFTKKKKKKEKWRLLGNILTPFNFNDS